jgi:hypothetical protein
VRGELVCMTVANVRHQVDQSRWSALTLPPVTMWGSKPRRTRGPRPTILPGKFEILVWER